MKKIFLGSDHRGFRQKELVLAHLKRDGFVVEDLGAYKFDENDDYPDIALKVTDSVLKIDGLGVVLCGSGMGVAIAANKIKGIRCGQGVDALQVESGKADDDINMLSIASDYQADEQVLNMVDKFIKTPFKQLDRFKRRIDKITSLEQL